MRRRIAPCVLLAAGALGCSGRTTTGASSGDAATAAADGQSAEDAPCVHRNIIASDYDQSCTADTDCTGISEGNVCDPCVFQAFQLAGAAINAGALAKYRRDIANTPGADGVGGVGCPPNQSTVSLPSNWGPFCCDGICHVGSQCPNATDAAAITSHAPSDTGPSTCHWPASLNDAGPGACVVGRAAVKCTYPSGVECEGGAGASSPDGLTMECISDDPTSCSGCSATAGVATCTNMCAPNEYAVSCGGPPRFSSDGGLEDFTYEQAPANCVGLGGSPGGSEDFCCPCD